MKNDNSKIFEELLIYKKRGYRYISAECTPEHTGYDRAVADFYEGDLDRIPNYTDWLHEYRIEVEDFVTFHDGSFIYGNKTSNNYDSDSSLEVISNEEFENDCEVILDGAIVESVDFLAFAVWNLEFTSIDQSINNFSELKNFYRRINEFPVFIGNSEAVIMYFLNEKLWSDESFLLEYFKSDFCSSDAYNFIFIKMDGKLERNKDFAHKITSAQPTVIKFFPAELNDLRNVALKSIAINAHYLKALSNKLLNDPGFINDAFEINPNIFRHLTEEQKSSRELALIAIKHNGENFEHIPDTLKGDKEILLAAMRNKNGDLIKFASSEIKGDKQFILDALESKIDCFEYVDTTLKSDDEVMLKAIEISDYNINHVSDELKAKVKSDKNLLIKLIKMGVSLGYIFSHPDEIADKEIIELALEHTSWGSVNIISEDLKNDRQLMLKMVSKNGGEIRYLPANLKSDKEFIITAVTQWVYYYERLDPVYRKDKEIALAALNKNSSYAEEYLPSELLDDTEIQAIIAKEE